jgi:hypothetical protein
MSDDAIAKATGDPRILRAALLWLRNHYDVGDPAIKDEVLARVDTVLGDKLPDHNDMEAFRNLYPRTSKEKP